MKAAVEEQCRALRLPAVAEQSARLAEVAVNRRREHSGRYCFGKTSWRLSCSPILGETKHTRFTGS
jgi:hypothetical protein